MMKLTSLPRAAIGLTALLLLIAISMKWALLGQVPGINADEAYSAVLMRDFAAAQGQWVWQTPTGRPLMPLYSGMVLLITQVLPPGFGYMRIAPVVSHFALLAAVYFALRSRLSPVKLWLLILLMCALPMHTAFARVAWEPCLIPLMVFLTVHFARTGRFITSHVFLLLAVMTHTTCIFLAPLILFAWAVRIAGTPGGRAKSRDMTLLVVFVLLTMALAAYTATGTPGAGQDRMAASMLTRLADANGWLNFFGRLFYTTAGGLVRNEFANVPFESGFLPSVKILGAVTALGFVALLATFIRARRAQAATLLAGFLLSLIAFYLVAGTQPFNVGYQRYVLWMSVPLVLLMFDALMLLPFYRSAALAVSALFLLYTAHGYFYAALRMPPGAYAPVYATAWVEPKRAALQWVKRQLHGERPEATPAAGRKVPFLAESWWFYWTARYWLYEERISFYDAEDPLPTGLPADSQMTRIEDIEQVLAQGGFVMGFANGPLASRLADAGLTRKYVPSVFYGARGVPLILIWHGGVPG